jgi:hypothetical protein
LLARRINTTTNITQLGRQELQPARQAVARVGNLRSHGVGQRNARQRVLEFFCKGGTFRQGGGTFRQGGGTFRQGGVFFSQLPFDLAMAADQLVAANHGLLKQVVRYSELQPSFLKLPPRLSRYVIQQIVGITAKFPSLFSV